MNLTTNAVHHQTPCATSVLRFFGVKGVTWNDRTKRNVWDDTMRRSGYSVRSRTSQLRKAEKTVGASRARLAEIAAKEPAILAFVIRVQNHVLVVDRTGQTIVDTAPRRADRRAIKKVMAVFYS